MPKCVYCGQQYENPRGLTLVKTDGTINYLCSSKCRKNMLMKRRNVNWIRKGSEEKKETMIRKEASARHHEKNEAEKKE